MILLFRLLGRLPLSLLQAVGSLLGGLVFLLARSERRRAAAHLALAFPDRVPAGLAWQSARAAGRTLTELPYLWQRPIEEVVGRVASVDGWEHVDAARARGDGVMMLTPHVGCFEITAQYIATRHPITVLYRPPKSEAFHPVMVHGRTRGQMKPAPADNSGVKQLLKALRKKEMIGMLPDQVPQSGEGVWAPFFSRPAYTMTLAARFSALDKVTTLFIFARRLTGGRYSIHVRPPTVPLEGTLEERTVEINREIEKIVLDAPDQYFWAYNRYKAPHAEAAAELTREGKQA